jgi:hypothetical protein
MNQTEYAEWERDAYMALGGKYTIDEIIIILEWFAGIKGQDERDMIGNEAVEAHLVFVTAGGKFDLYNSLMSRLFIYAPFILEQAKKT